MSENTALPAAAQVLTHHFPVENVPKRVEARVPYKRDDKRGDGRERITLDAKLARVEGYNAFVQAGGVEAIGLYWLIAENGWSTRKEIMRATGWGKDKLAKAVNALVAEGWLQVEPAGYGEPEKLILLARPHSKDDPKSFVIHRAENPPTEAAEPPLGGKSASSERRIRPQLAENPPAYKEVIQQLKVKSKLQDQQQQQQERADADDGGGVSGVSLDQDQTQEQPQPQEQEQPQPVALLEGEIMAAETGPDPGPVLAARPLSEATVNSLERQIRRYLHPKLPQPRKTLNVITHRHVGLLADEFRTRYDETVVVAGWRLWIRKEMGEPQDHVTSYPVLDFLRGGRGVECIAEVAPVAHDEQKLTALLEQYPDNPEDAAKLRIRKLLDEEHRRREAGEPSTWWLSGIKA